MYRELHQVMRLWVLHRMRLTKRSQSGPTDFRREDISIPGLDPEQYVQLTLLIPIEAFTGACS